MELVEYVQFKLNELGENAKIDDDKILPYLLSNRLLDYDDVSQAVGSLRTVSIGATSSLVTMTMRDLYAGTDSAYQFYAGQPGIHLHPQERHFLIDDVREDEDSGAGFEFDPVTFTLNFEEAFSSETTVKAIGHIVNIDGPGGVMYDVIGVLAGWMFKLASTRGKEFDTIASRYERWRQLHYGHGAGRGGFRVH